MVRTGRRWLPTALVGACAGDPSAAPARPAGAIVPASVTALVGDTVRVSLGRDGGHPAPTPIWRVEPTALGTVDAGGRVVAAREGRGSLIAEWRQDGAMAMARADLIVLSRAACIRAVATVPRAMVLRPGELRAVATGIEGCRSGLDASVRAEVADTAVVQADAQGTGVSVRGRAVGTTTVRILAAANPAVGTDVLVTVVCGALPAITMLVAPERIVLAPGERARLRPVVRIATETCLPPALLGAVVFASGDTSVATVDADGVVRARRQGLATVSTWPAAFPNARAVAVVRVAVP